MRNRDSVTRKLELIDDKLRLLEQIVNRQSPISEYMSTIERTKELLSDARTLINNEPTTPDEIRFTAN
jgi:DNA-binding protein H-NS